MLRALVACGWFGIQTWIGALALNTLLTAAWPAWAGIAAGIWIAFAIFWLIQVGIIINGLEGIKKLEGWSAPLLLGGGALLLGWAIVRGGGLGHILSESVRLQTAHVPFWRLFPAALTANVGYWATLSLNIPDFTRYARSQRSQALGQALGLPATMTAFAFIGVAVTSATIVIFGEAIWDPVVLIARIGSAPVIIFGALVVPARAVDDEHGGQRRVAGQRLLEPRAAAHQLRHRRADHGGDRHRDDAVEALRRRGGVHLHVAHRLLEPDGRDRRHPDRRLLGAAAARAVAVDLFKLEGRYTYSGGVNPRAVVALVLAVLPVVPGFLHAATTPGGQVANPDVPRFALHLRVVRDVRPELHAPAGRRRRLPAGEPVLRWGRPMYGRGRPSFRPSFGRGVETAPLDKVP